MRIVVLSNAAGALLALAITTTSVIPTASAQDADAYGGLPPGEGRDLVFGTCTPCHSARLISQQGMSRERWDSTLDWMIEEQGMAEPMPEQRDQILDYLAAHLSEDREAGASNTPSTTTRPSTGMSFAPLPIQGE